MKSGYKFKPDDIVIEHWTLFAARRRLGVIVQHGSGVAIRWLDGADGVIVMTVGGMTQLYDRAKNYD